MRLDHHNQLSDSEEFYFQFSTVEYLSLWAELFTAHPLLPLR